jgi:hypothetical protein
MLKTEKELLQEIYNDTLKNDLSRKIELEHLQGFVVKRVKKMKNKEEKKQHLQSIEQKIEALGEEQAERKNVLGLIKKLIK